MAGVTAKGRARVMVPGWLVAVVIALAGGFVAWAVTESNRAGREMRKAHEGIDRQDGRLRKAR